MQNAAAELVSSIAEPRAPTLAESGFPIAVDPSSLKLYWAWPTAVSAVLCALSIGRPWLWSDELATWAAVRLDWTHLMRLTSHVDAVLLPYIALEKVWAAVAGTSNFALRLPSALAMTGAATLIAVLGARVADRRVGLFAGLAFSLVPATARYGQEARPYGWAVFFAVLATLLLVRWIERPGIRRGLAYALAIALLGSFHIVALLLLLAHAFAVRPRWRAWAIWAAAGVTPVLPLVYWGVGQREQVAWIPPARVTALMSPETIFIGAAAGGLIVALGLLAMSRTQPVLLFAAWAVVPFAALVLVGQFIPLFCGRYLLFIVPGWAILAALTLGRLTTGRAVAVLTTIGVFGGYIQYDLRRPSGHGQGTGQAGEIIAKDYRPGDGIAFSMLDYPTWVGRDIVSRYVPESRRPSDVFEQIPQRAEGNLAPIECADLGARLNERDPPRMWVLRLQDMADPLERLGGEKERLLRSRYHLASSWMLVGLTLALYERS